MALIACPDCSTQVSDRAPACPKCGAPIAASARPPVVTIQQTNQNAKVHIFLSMITFNVGFIWCLVNFAKSTPSSSFIFPGILLVIGLLWNMVARFVAWWEHG